MRVGGGAQYVEPQAPRAGENLQLRKESTLAKQKKGNLTVYLNVHKKEDDASPHYRGKMNVEGKNYDISLWINGEISGVPIHLSGQLSKVLDE